MSGKWFTVGKIVNTHGLRGELKVLSQTDFGDLRFAVGNKLVMIHEEHGTKQEVEIAGSREHKGNYIIKLKGYNDINEVEKYKGWLLKVAEEQLGKLDEGEYYFHEIIGCRVVTDEGEELGTISEILRPGANDVWVVDRPKGKGSQVLIPVIDEVLLNVDIATKTVTVHLMEGLI
ncbi:ribosome maturation factor RimM [Paenibacillus sp. BIHB 4019]|uniref:Ribosome maturation factor RimM n=1 Tax=Paenibacillus sp. BIHB 4019 TaxID=1870819 RepID=A0A1B2DPQ3_9BACL|nr:ribosome maturation factor RimM [Paenibacillus sp. BIHB 4019]ANY69696.1 ribosome maturation factor RimM [Paenibacillus sp. BIHB 4019]